MVRIRVGIAYEEIEERDRLLEGIRANQEQFHGPRYWEKPVETPGVPS